MWRLGLACGLQRLAGFRWRWSFLALLEHGVGRLRNRAPHLPETPARLCSCSCHTPLRISVIFGLFDPVRNSRISLANVVQAADLVWLNGPCDNLVTSLHNLPQGVKQRSCYHTTNKERWKRPDIAP